MNSEVIQKIADMFQVSFEKATEFYPLIRTQYTVYTIFDFIGTVLIALLFAALIFGGMYFFMKSQDYELSDTDEETLAFKSMLKLFIKSRARFGSFNCHCVCAAHGPCSGYFVYP